MHKLNVFMQVGFWGAFITIILFATDASGQSGQVGNATVIPGLTKDIDPYGINSSADSTEETGFGTRHHRAGNNGGIGGSFLQTESVTSESKPVSNYRYSPQPASPAIPMPSPLGKPESFSESMLYSPASSSISSSKPSPSFINTPKSDFLNTGKTDTTPYSLFWGHQKAGGSSKPLSNNIHGPEFLPDDL